MKLPSGDKPAHKFVLSARSDAWSELGPAQSLDWSHLDPGVGEAMLEWVYTDRVGPGPAEHHDGGNGDAFTLKLMRTGNAFGLRDLLRRGEERLMGSVSVNNCIR